MGNGGLMTFGSHTMSHVSLTRVHAEGFEYELVRSKAELEDQIGRPVTGFAYPYGTARDFNRATAKTVAAAGYTWAVTGMNGLNTQQSDRFALRRTKIEGDINMALFDKAMQGALDPWVVVDKLGRLL
jgi:peptidoglycan/xylan/chitin deacetylase (PgdA/CDA1 family)